MADTATEEFIVGEDAGACFYTRYPNGITGSNTEAYDLTCPACGDDHLKLIGEWYPARQMMLGDKMRCWTCKHEFHVTENCWKWRKMKK